MPFYQGGVGQAWPPSRMPLAPSIAFQGSPRLQPQSGPPGLLSDELWPTVQLASVGVGPVERRPPRRDPVPTHTPTDDEPNSIPTSVINLYRESLDDAGLSFLRHGPQSFDEQLAYAQQVRPDAYRRTLPAPPAAQERFRQWRDVDWDNSFVGPDGIVYRRSLFGEEQPAARIRRAYENTVGGYEHPSLDKLLQQMGYPDPSTRWSPETRARIADIPPADRPYSVDDTAWRAWADEQGVNPDTWRFGKPLPAKFQRSYQFGIERDPPEAYGGGVFVGPDGILYRQSARTRPDNATRNSHAFRHLWAREEIRDHPPDPWNLLGNGLEAAGPGLLLGGVIRSGSRGNAETQQELADLVDAARRSNRNLKHVAGSKNEQGKEVKEDYIPNPAGTLLGDGRKKSIRPDATFMDQILGHLHYIQHQDYWRRTGKATPREEEVAQRLFRYTQSQGYNEPWSYVWTFLKRHQMDASGNNSRNPKNPQQPKNSEEEE